MKTKFRFKYILFILLIFCSEKTFSQCFQIESVLVAACVTVPNSEGYNEMVRFKVGPAPLNTGSLTVNWPAQTWQGLIQNATTAANVAAINATIALAGGCAQLIEPVGGVLPANAEVILVTSENFSATANVFGAISQNIYILFQSNSTTTAGHFGNYNATPGIRTLSMNFGVCTDAVSYERSLLSPTAGATANFTPSGVATYTNPGCVAPVDVFAVDAGTTPVNACPGATINLSGTATGFTTVAWTAASGSFGTAASLASTYTLAASASGSIVLTLTATNACGSQITDTVTINTSATATPTFNAVPAICSGNALAPLPTTSTNGITGTWSPVIDNTATTTYTFTPTAGQCATTATLTITVNTANTIPSFNAIAPVCTGTPLAPLATTSTNGITGTWSPAINNTASTVYTFTPNPGQCAVSRTLLISIGQPVIPSFNPVVSICENSTVTLPTTSVNGILGVWSPPINNTATTTYTFTPNAGECAVTTTMTIQVDPNVVPTFNAIAPICAGSFLAALPTTATNGITGAWAPAINNITTTTYTFTPSAGECAMLTTLTVIVNQPVLPIFNAISPICFGTPLSPLPTTSTNGITGIWLPALNNTVTTTYTFTPNAGQCASTTTLTVTVNNNTIPTFSGVTSICSGAILSPLPTTSTNGITGVWSPALNNTTTTTYTFTPNSGQCAVNGSLTINVNPIATPTFNAVPPVCTGTAIAPLPTTSTNGITGIWSPAINNTATTTYTFTPNAAQCANTTTLTITVNALNTAPTFTAVPAICSGATLQPLPTTSNNGITGTWSPAMNNTATTTYTFMPNPGQCAVNATLSIIVNAQTLPNFNSIAPLCSGSTLAPLPTTSINGITGSWSPSINNNATTTYAFTPNTGQCAIGTTLTITINTPVTPVFTSVAPICSGNILASLPNISNNGITGVWSPALNNTATTTYTFTPNANQCALTATLTIAVNPRLTPTFNILPGICLGTALPNFPTTSNNGVVGVWTPAPNGNATTTYTFVPNTGQCAIPFNWTVTVFPNIVPTFNLVGPICSGEILPPLPTTSTNGVVGTWSPAINNTVTTTYTFTPAPGPCAETTFMTIDVNPLTIPIFDPNDIPVFICAGATIAPLPTVSANGIFGSWSPALDNTATQTYVFTPDPGQCADINALSINVIQNVTKNETHYICIGAAGTVISPAVINIGLSPLQYSFAWTFNGNTIANTTESYQTSVAGLYTVVATHLITGCAVSTIIATVLEVTPASGSATIVNEFGDNQQIVVTVIGGLGDYEYQLENGPFQSSNIFMIYHGGDYTIRVRDKLGCNNFELRVTAMNYPKFFTPNSDGYHDTWNVEGLLPEQQAEIYIFDRYGKLVKQISPYGIGWDGTYNGIELPSTDYWFKLLYRDKYGNAKEFKAHFALKR